MLDIRRPFTRAQARAAGITDAQLRGPRYVRLLGGVYIGAGAPDLVIAPVPRCTCTRPRP